MNYILAILAFIVFGPLVLVGIGLPFKVDKGVRYFDDGTSTQHYDLPRWLLWLTNKKDGLTGDRRGWYWNEYMAGLPAWFKMLIWSGWRNPWNYLKRHIIGINVRDYSISKVIGDGYVRDDFNSTGFQILKATHKITGSNRFALYWVRRWDKSNRAIVVQLGWKIKLSHNLVDVDKFVGFTFEPNPFKDIS